MAEFFFKLCLTCFVLFLASKATQVFYYEAENIPVPSDLLSFAHFIGISAWVTLLATVIAAIWEVGGGSAGGTGGSAGGTGGSAGGTE